MFMLNRTHLGQSQYKNNKGEKMAKHAKPKQTLRNATLTKRGEAVFYTLIVAAFFVAVGVLSALIERIG